MTGKPGGNGFHRRSFLAIGTLAATAAAGRAAPAAADSAPAPAVPAAGVPAAGIPAAGAPAAVAMRLRINGEDRALTADIRTSLLDALREHLGLPGSKKGCDHGQCGACTVMLDGRTALACLTLAVDAQGSAIATIEGLAQREQLHPMQQAFIDNDAFQCGYCTPGQIVSAIACVRTGHAETDGDIREFMSGNLCRCAAYPNIVAAIREAAPQLPPRQGA